MEWGVVFSWDCVLAFAFFFFVPLQFGFRLLSCQVNNDHVVHFGDVMVIKSGKGGAPSKAHVRGSILWTRQLDQLGSVIPTEM